MQPTLVKVDRDTLDAYAGRYRLESGKDLNIARNERHLLVDVVGDGIATYFASSQKSFFSNTADEQIVFQAEAKHVTELIWTANGKEQRATRIGAQ